MDFVVTEGLRTVERQREMVRLKRSTTMNSRHLTGHAVDLYALVDVNADGEVTFEEMSHPRLMRQIADIIKSAAAIENVPVIWGGDWRTFKDYPHFELDRRMYPASNGRQ